MVDDIPLYGLRYASHDFSMPEAWGKNIFTNAFPVAVTQYLALGLGLHPILICATQDRNGRLGTTQRLAPWENIIATDPVEARFQFGGRFEPYRRYSTDRVSRQVDVIAADLSGRHLRALDVKLTAVPDSASSPLSDSKQSAEIVVRPIMIEQLALSLVQSFGSEGRDILHDTIHRHLVVSHAALWDDSSWIQSNTLAVVAIINDLVAAGIAVQTPMVLNVIWRTVGTTPQLENHCFDTFVWTDIAFLMLFRSSADPARSEITRPLRALIWLVRMLWDYVQGGRVDSLDPTALAYGLQTDKAGSFSGRATVNFLGGPYLSKPRVSSSAVGAIIAPEYRSFIAPERRLDAALYIESIVQSRCSG